MKKKYIVGVGKVLTYSYQMVKNHGGGEGGVSDRQSDRKRKIKLSQHCWFCNALIKLC